MIRHLAAVATHPLTWLLAALGLNLRNNVRNDRLGTSLPTMCGTARQYVPWPLFWAAWLGITAWLLPHYSRPFWRVVVEAVTPDAVVSTPAQPSGVIS